MSELADMIKTVVYILVVLNVYNIFMIHISVTLVLLIYNILFGYVVFKVFLCFVIKCKIQCLLLYFFSYKMFISS